MSTEICSCTCELVKGLPTLLATIVIGGIAAYIAYQQWKVSRAKLQLDLFEKRFAIFDATWTELSRAIQDRWQEFATPQFTNLIPQAEFLFSPEISNYMREIASKLSENWLIAQKTKANHNVIPPEFIEKQAALSGWLANHASEECKRIFAPYMSFSVWADHG